MYLLFFILNLFLGVTVLVIVQQTLTKEPVLSTLFNRFLKRLYFLKFAPILAFLVLLILTILYLHTKMEVRLSHAWYVAQLWTYSSFLLFSYIATKKYSYLIVTGISLIFAIYSTPLYHYEAIFHGTTVIISDIVGLLMFVNMWITSSTIILLAKRTI